LNTQGTLEEFLAEKCQEFGFLGIFMTNDDGLVLARFGESLDDDCIGLLPGWLNHSEEVALQDEGMNGLTCCCLIPKSKKVIVLGWKTEVSEHQTIYLAAQLKQLPPKAIAALAEISAGVSQYFR